MSTTYTRGTKEHLELAEDVARRWHPVISRCGVTIDVLVAHEIDEETGEVSPCLMHHGFPAAATIKIVPLKQRALKQADALLTIDGAVWDRLSKAQRLALLDHEMTHLMVAADAGGLVTIDGAGTMIGTAKLDDQGRPKLRMRQHDNEVSWFREVAMRHGRAALEVQCVDQLVEGNGQVAWNFGLLTQAAE